MSIGISDEHVELAASLRKWAAGARRRRGWRAPPRATPTRRFDEVWAAVGEMGVADDRAARVGRRRRRVGARPGRRPGGVRPRAGARPAARAGGRARALLGELARGRPSSGCVDPAATWSGTRPSATHLLLGDADDRWFVVPARRGRRSTPRQALDLTRRFGGGRGRPRRRRRRCPA